MLACSDSDPGSFGDIDRDGDDALAEGGSADADAGEAEDSASAEEPDADHADTSRAEDAGPDTIVVMLDSGKDPDCTGLKATIRDFKTDHEDFEGPGNNMVNRGIVNVDLGADHKPVYAMMAPRTSTSGAANFNQWYRDVAGVNEAFMVDIPLTPMGAGLFVYDNAAFFPIDGRGFGNEGNPHNYHFTTEIHTRFTYQGGEVFTFRGDDDLWAFVNGKLAIDLGGLHTPQMMTINFDQRAAELGLTVGETYPMDIFHAERHRVESNFRIETSISCFSPADLL
jgi:fibro-slime domain-containing protein